MHVEVRDPDDKIILSKVYSSEGKWTFTSSSPGEHVICLYTNSTKWFSGSQLVIFYFKSRKYSVHSKTGSNGIFTGHQISADLNVYPPASEASREVANLT